MKLYNPEKPLFSIHVPKCGGTSFHSVLEQWFGPNLHRPDFSERLNGRPCIHDLRGSICVHGHFNKKRKLGVMDYYPEADQFVTILRDPFEMLVSRYFYAKGRWDNQFGDDKPIRSIREQFPDVRAYLKGGRKKCYLVDFLPYEVTLENYAEMFDKYFVYVGITEDLQTSVNELARRLGFPSVPLRRLNISVHDEEVTEEMREEFIKSHPLEYAIYNYTVQNYKQ